MNYKERLKLYNSLCTEACDLLKKYNPCKISNGKCTRGYFCCKGCQYLNESTNKCNVDSLLCLLWLCDEATKNVDQYYLTKAEYIFTDALCQGLIVMRGSTADALNTSRNSIEYPVDAMVKMPWGWIYKIEIPIWNMDEEE